MKTKITYILTITLVTGFLLAACVPPAGREPAPTSLVDTTGMDWIMATGGVPPTASQDKFTYQDPLGWYSFTYPQAWSPGAEPGTFAGEDGYVSTGYLPQMAYMRDSPDVCQWLANIDLKDDGLAAIEVSLPSGDCQLSFPAVGDPLTRLAVIQNPAAELAERYLYIRADADHFEPITASLSWLKPVAAGEKFDYGQAPLSPQDAAFWEAAARNSLPEGMTLTEYPLTSGGSSAGPGTDILLDYLTPDAGREYDAVSATSAPPTELVEINRLLEPFGYALNATQGWWFELRRAGELAIDNISHLPKVYIFPTADGGQLAFLARRVIDTAQSYYQPGNAETYLVRNDGVTLWDAGPVVSFDPGRSPIYFGGEVLWLRASQDRHVTVYDDRHAARYSFATYYGSYLPVKRFSCWQDQWVLEVSDFVILNGTLLNQQYGYEEVFDWRKVNGKPLYFFRQGARSGISYDGRILPVSWAEIAHGYCCALALNNPTGAAGWAGFFARNEGPWFRVILDID